MTEYEVTALEKLDEISTEIQGLVETQKSCNDMLFGVIVLSILVVLLVWMLDWNNM